MQISVIQIIKEGFTLYRSIFFKLLPFCIFIGFVEVLTQAHISLLIFHQIIIDAIFSAGIFAYLLSFENKEESQFKFQDFFQGIKRVWDLLLLSILLNVRIFFGFILLVFPAIYLMNIYSQALYLLLERKGDPFEVLALSKNLVRPYFGKVFLINILIFMLIIPELFVTPGQWMVTPFLFLWSILTTPLGACLGFKLYRHLGQLSQVQIPK